MKLSNPSNRSTAIKSKAREVGFDLCGIAPATDLPELAFLAEWLSRGYAGSMVYLARSAERRADVRRVLPSARSVIVTATVYNTDRPYSTECGDPGRAQIARYAWGDDYHDVIGPRLAALINWMRLASPEPFEARAYVDTGYGCDICQEVCPWNAAAPVAADPAWQPRSVWDQPALRELGQRSEDELRSALEGSAMRRAKLEGLRRNIAAAEQNAVRHRVGQP